MVMIILGLVAFYFPVRNTPQAPTSSETDENYSASLSQIASTSTVPVSASSTSVPGKADFKDMSGFFGLGQENDLVNQIGSSNSSSAIDDIFNGLNR